MLIKNAGIVGAGLAGSEAAWQLVARGIKVTLYEQKPERFSPAHHLAGCAELVCSNSFRGDEPTQAVGLLKREMETLDSLILAEARANAVAAGGALAVDRIAFSESVTRRLRSHPLITFVSGELKTLPAERPVIVATGPLTGDDLAASVAELAGSKSLAFYDAIAPIVFDESLDRTRIFAQSRYGKGTGDDYLNCPFTEAEYMAFIGELKTAARVSLHDFESARPFEGCLPIEEMADRGDLTLAYGPMKPVGLEDPRTGKRPFAVVQLRREDAAGQIWNLVGFQTKMTHPEQKRVFRMIPGLEHAEFARLGTVHRNTFLNSPMVLTDAQEMRAHPGIYFAGQITGVEGYLESAASGLLAGLAVAARLMGEAYTPPPPTTALGGLIRHVSAGNPETFQPMNINYGLMDPLDRKHRRSDRKTLLAERAFSALTAWRLRRAA